MRLGLCSRTNDVVEPLIKPQWYVSCSGIAKEALDAVMDDENRKIEIIPRQYTADWKRYLHLQSTTLFKFLMWLMKLRHEELIFSCFKQYSRSDSGFWLYQTYALRSKNDVIL